MGLDITAYRFCDVGDTVIEQWDCRIYNGENFKGRADDLVNGATYCVAEMIKFRAGSYSSYNTWRDMLAQMAGYARMEDDAWRKHLVKAAGGTELYRELKHPYAATAWAAESGSFWELINFSDCEGVIGAVTSAKLVQDFKEHERKAAAFSNCLSSDWCDDFFELYEKWQEAFTLASQGGAVCFG